MGILNTTPRTWVANEFVTETMLNTEVRDASTNLQSAWTAYTPTWAATTAPAIGNGTWDAAYQRWGKTVSFRINLTMGSTTTFGTGQWSLTLPVAAKTDKIRFANCQAFDSSANGYFPAAGTWLTASSAVVLWAPATTAGNADRALNVTSPFTWAVSDVLSLSGTYEAS